LYLKKLVFGPWFCRPVINGKSKEVDKLAVTYPKLVREEIDDNEKYQINTSFLQKYGKEWASNFLDRCSVDCERLNNIDDLFLPVKYRNPSQFPRNYIADSKSLIESISKNRTVGVKYHPSEEKGDYLNVSKMSNVLVIPKFVSSEFIVMYVEGLRRIFSLASTSLLSAKWIKKDMESFSTAKLFGYDDTKFLRSLRIAGVKILES